MVAAFALTTDGSVILAMETNSANLTNGLAQKYNLDHTGVGAATIRDVSAAPTPWSRDMPSASRCFCVVLMRLTINAPLRKGGNHSIYLDDDTIRGWHKTYREGGWDALSTDSWKGGQSRMTPAQETELCAWLDERFCRSTVEIRAHIAAQYGVDYSHSGCIKLLARLGYEYRKPKGLPRVAPEEKQAEFIALYERLLNELGTDEAVYFADAVHPEYQTKPSYGWVKAGSNPAVTTTAGRGRVNIHGALNLENFDAPFVEPTTVDGVSAAQLLAKIEARNPLSRIIYVIWDNAAYHKGPDVREFLKRPECRIRLIQLPPYCPHLNPIERLWAVMHQYVTHNHYYPTQKQFADAVLRFFRETLPNEWQTFRDQVSDNFRVVNHDKFRVLG